MEFKRIYCTIIALNLKTYNRIIKREKYLYLREKGNKIKKIHICNILELKSFEKNIFPDKKNESESSYQLVRVFLRKTNEKIIYQFFNAQLLFRKKKTNLRESTRRDALIEIVSLSTKRTIDKPREKYGALVISPERCLNVSAIIHVSRIMARARIGVFLSFNDRVCRINSFERKHSREEISLGV